MTVNQAKLVNANANTTEFSGFFTGNTVRGAANESRFALAA
jgi:hypothetical protein